MTDDADARCSFYGSSRREVAVMFKSQMTDAAVCSECIDWMGDRLTARKGRKLLAKRKDRAA